MDKDCPVSSESKKIKIIKGCLAAFVFFFIIVPVVIIVVAYINYWYYFSLRVINDSSQTLTVTIKRNEKTDREFNIPPKQRVIVNRAFDPSYTYIVNIKSGNGDDLSVFQIDKRILKGSKLYCTYTVAIPEEELWDVNKIKKAINPKPTEIQRKME